MRIYKAFVNRPHAVQLLQGAIAGVMILVAVSQFGPQAGAWELAPFVGPTPSPTASPPAQNLRPTPTSYIPTATPPPLIHVVQKGEVLGMIARMYDTTEEELVKANGMKSADEIIAIGQELIVAGAHRTPVPLVFDTPTPTPTSTPPYKYPAPVLLSPLTGENLGGPSPAVTLQWASVGILAEGEWYEVRVWSPSADPANALRFRTRSTALALTPSALDGERTSAYNWQVLVIYAGHTLIRKSPASETRLIHWE